jgi:hypothetical protein
VYAQVDPLWATVTVWPAMVKVPVCEQLLVLAATV